MNSAVLNPNRLYAGTASKPRVTPFQRWQAVSNPTVKPTPKGKLAEETSWKEVIFDGIAILVGLFSDGWGFILMSISFIRDYRKNRKRKAEIFGC